MTITAGQLARLMVYVHERYASGPYDLSNVATVCELISRDFPEITDVADPPSPAELERRYVRDFWRSYDVPPLDPEPGPSIGRESAASIEYNRRLRATYHGAPPPSPAERMLSELNLLRSNPMGALTYVVMRANHYNNDEAMRYARVSGGVWDMISAATPAPISDLSGRREPSGPPVPEEFTPDFITLGLSSL